MNNPLISIIIPTFNRAHLIGETLDSVMAQTYQNWECMIVDDGSTDNTLEVVTNYVKKDNRFQYQHRPENRLQGANACRNFGAEISVGEYLIFLDSDDYLMNFCLSQRIDTISFLDDFSFAVFPMAIKKANGKITKKSIPEMPCYIDEFLSDNLYWGIMCSLWNRNVFFNLHGFSETYPRLNDPDLHIRAMLYFPNDYYVFNKTTPDSIYNISDNCSANLFASKVYHSLELFIPDIRTHLEKTGNGSKIIFLKGYLKMWLSSNMSHASYIQNKNVINLFYNNKVISLNKKILFKVNIFIYFSLTKSLTVYRKKVIQKMI